MNSEIILILSAILVTTTWFKPQWTSVIVLLSICFGEFSRLSLPIGPRGIIFSDFAIPLTLLTWLIHHWAKHKPIPKLPYFTPLVLFIALNTLSLILTPLELSTSSYLDSIFYAIRFITYVGFATLISATFNSERLQKQGIHLLFCSGLILAVLGFLQLHFYPDFKEMAEIGWDPHQNRLLATWFDPNFLGGFLGLIATLGLSVILHSKKRAVQMLYTIGTLILLYSLFLTYSRSGYLMFAASAGILLFIKNRALLALLIVASLAVIPLSDRAQERVSQIYTSALGLFSNSYEHSIDVTARFRVESWQQSLTLFQQHPILGTGYNTIKYARIDAGFEKDPQSHAATGADSSLFLILATTGSLGLLAFLWIYLSTLFILWHQRKTSSLHTQITTLTSISTTVGLLIHSFFVNSLFFPFILLPYWFLIGLSLPTTTKKDLL